MGGFPVFIWAEIFVKVVPYCFLNIGEKKSIRLAREFRTVEDNHMVVLPPYNMVVIRLSFIHTRWNWFIVPSMRLRWRLCPPMVNQRWPSLIPHCLVRVISTSLSRLFSVYSFCW